jgi:hypothetical protein
MIDKKKQDISFSIVKPSKDGSRPGYRRGNYDASGGGFGGPGKSGGPKGGSNNAPGDGRDTGSDYGQFDRRVVNRTVNNPPTITNTSGDDNPPTTFNIHGGPTYTPPTTNIFDEVALTGYGKVPGSAVGPNSQYQKNINLSNQLLNTPYSFKSKFPSLNVLGNTLGKFGYDRNTKFFVKNSIGGKINPETGEPFGYGIDGYKDYIRQRTLGDVDAYGGTQLSQNEINRRAGDGDRGGIMDIYNYQDLTDADGDGDVDQDDFIFKYFDETGKTLQAGAGGVGDLMTSIRERISNLFS